MHHAAVLAQPPVLGEGVVDRHFAHLGQGGFSLVRSGGLHMARATSSPGNSFASFAMSLLPFAAMLAWGGRLSSGPESGARSGFKLTAGRAQKSGDAQGRPP